MLAEEYKNIIDFPNYEISNLGNIRNKTTNKILKHRTMTRGYKGIVLYKDEIKKPFLVHRLLAQYFIPNPNNLPIIDHIDQNTSNNNISNLRWASLSTNNFNTKKHTYKENFSSIYRGVHKSNKTGKYISTVVYNGVRNHLGTFENELDAFNARNEFIKNNNIII